MTKLSRGVDIMNDVVTNQIIAEERGERDPEFDALMKRLEFYRLSPFQKIVRIIYWVIGVGLGLLLLLAIIQ